MTNIHVQEKKANKQLDMFFSTMPPMGKREAKNFTYLRQWFNAFFRTVTAK